MLKYNEVTVEISQIQVVYLELDYYRDLLKNWKNKRNKKPYRVYISPSKFLAHCKELTDLPESLLKEIIKTYLKIL